MDLFHRIFGQPKQLKPEKPPKPKKIKPPEPNTLVLDQGKGFGLEYVKEPLGRQWRYENQLVHWMTRDEKGNMKPVEVSPGLGKFLPEELYWALHCREAEIIFALPASLMEKLGIAGMYILIGALLFFMFIIGTSS